MDKKDIIVLTGLFLVSFFIWTLPFQDNPLPFGEGDGAYHFAYSQYISSNDNSMFYSLPNFLHFWYYDFNSIIPGAPEYPPSSHLNTAFMQIVAGETVPVFIYYAITCFFGALTIYFLMRYLFGFFPAVLAGFGMAFSNREILLFLFGQRPTITPFAIIPVVIYAYYRFFTSLFSEKTEHKYLYITILLMASQFLLHLQALLVTLVILFVFTVLMLLKERKLPLKKLNYKRLGVFALIFIIICAPFLPIYLGARADARTASFQDISRIFRWNITPEEEGGYPPSYLSFSDQYGSKLMLIPLLLGLVYLLIKRNAKSILLLSWFLAVYLLLHIDVFLGVSFGRIARMLIAEPMLFFGLIALGVFAIPKFIKLDVNTRSLINIILLAVFIILFIFMFAVPQSKNLPNQYATINRITEPQVEASKWINENIPENGIVYNYGALTYGKKRFMLAYSQHYVDNFNGEIINGSVVNSDPWWFFLEENNVSYYFMFDYSDLAVLAQVPQFAQGAQQQVQQLQEIESGLFANTTPLYDKNQIRVYKFENQ